MSRIVIMEDDLLMRSLMAEWLAAEGYGVNGGVNATEAPGRTDLVIVDLYMPRHLGIERLREVRSTHPGAPIIAVSGQFRSGVRRAGSAAQALGVERVIAKPFGRETLLEAVRSVIEPRIDGVA